MSENPDFFKKNLFILSIAILTVFNIIVYNFFVKTGGIFGGQFIAYDKNLAMQSSLVTFLIGIPVVSLVFGLLVALFPYKQ